MRHANELGQDSSRFRGHPAWVLTPLAAAILLAAHGSVLSLAHAQPAGGAWFAAGAGAGGQARAAQRAPAPGAAIPASARQQAQAREQLSRSIANLSRTANAIAAQQAAQEAARAQAQHDPSVPEGLAQGGLWDRDAAGNPLAWRGAQRPVHTVEGGRHHVAIRQTESRAILNWDTFNVGKSTTVEFQQQASDAVLNKVVGADARPSQIQGQIQAEGTVMLVNQNGVVFSGTSQVNVRNLVAAAGRADQALDTQFLDHGLYSNGSAPTLREAAGPVLVQAGARIATHRPASATQGGGYVLLAGSQAHNAGHISTPGGQTALAAGESFVIARGYTPDGNPASTTRGNEITPILSGASLSDPQGSVGTVVNTGLIQAATGDITLTGRNVTQAGVAVATTSTSARGTLHLVNPAQASAGQGRVTLGEHSVTAIVLEETGAAALDSQREAGRSNPEPDRQGPYVLDDFRDLSRIEIRTDNTVQFQGRDDGAGGALALATGGQIVVDAVRRSLLEAGAELDVSGAVGVRVAMEANNLRIDVQGNEQRDAPVNREGGQLNNSSVWIDRRTLVHVPAGTNGYETDRWYTAGGLLEVGGYLATSGRTVGEWMAQGGVVHFTGGDVVARAGSRINLSGGTLDVQAGRIRQSWLRGEDGRLYEVSRAPGDLLYQGLYRGYEAASARWGVTRHYYNPLVAPGQRSEQGYTVGRDAGRLVIGTANAVLEADVLSQVYQGPRQNQAPQAGLDGLLQPQTALARRGALIVGQWHAVFDPETGLARDGVEAGPVREIVLGAPPPQAEAVALDDEVAPGREGVVQLDAQRLSAMELGMLRVAASEQVTVLSALQLAEGGQIILHGPGVSVLADLTAQGGHIGLGNVYQGLASSNTWQDLFIGAPAGGAEQVLIGPGVRLDVSGAWTNALLHEQDEALAGGWRQAWRHGGTVSVRSRGAVSLQDGSAVDAASGAARLADGALLGGRGGGVTLEAGALGGDGSQAGLALHGALRGYGVAGGGTLALVDSGQVVIGQLPGDPDSPFAQAGTVLEPTLFGSGFADYRVTGGQGLLVAPDTQLQVFMPVLRGTGDMQAGTAQAGLEVWLPPAFQEDPVSAVMTARGGASLALNAGTAFSAAADRARVHAHLAGGSHIEVDAGQSITVRSIGEILAQGTVRAHGGRIELSQVSNVIEAEDLTGEGIAHQRAIRVAGTLDVSGLAVSARSRDARRYGQLLDAGTIVLGGTLDEAAGTASASDVFVVVQDGAVLDARGAAGQFDAPGAGAGVFASHGGAVSIVSYNGIVLDGQVLLQAGGAGARAGSLAIGLESPYYSSRAPLDNAVLAPREIVLTQDAPARDPQAPLAYGSARLSAEQLARTGADELALYSNGLISFEDDVRLSAAQGIRLYAGALALSEQAAEGIAVTLAAPYVRLGGVTGATTQDNFRHAYVDGGRSARPATGSFTVQAQWLDVRDLVTFGARSSYRNAQDQAVTVDRRGFADVLLASDGDIRFLRGNTSRATVLAAPLHLTLAGAQVYPATHAVARVLAGPLQGGASYAADGLLRIVRPEGWQDAAEPPVPLSVFGSLALGAAAVEQAGVVRAPLGSIDVGTSSQTTSGAGDTAQVRLLPGSLTSVSAQGLVMPYGGTIDGITYEYGGQAVSLAGLGGVAPDGRLATGVTLSGTHVQVEGGAVLDLSGGGELLGAGFVSGRGGSTDARLHPLVRSTDGGFVLPGLADHPVYAIVPGLPAHYAPLAAEHGAGDPLIGQTITLGQGVPGLPAGTYTLLPSNYALLPGAYRVELNLADARSLGAPRAPAGALALRNGSWLAGGQLGQVQTGARDARVHAVTLTAPDVLRRYSQYDETSYAEFIVAAAQRQGIARAMLPADARGLQLRFLPRAAGQDPALALSFEGSARFAPAEGGYGNGASVVGNALVRGSESFEILPEGAAPTAGFAGVSLPAPALNAIGGDRLSIGGAVANTYGTVGNQLRLQSVDTSSIFLRGGAELAAPQVLLISGDQAAGQIVVEAGARINTIGQGAVAYDSTHGFVYVPETSTVLAVSNGWLDLLAPRAPDEFTTIGGQVAVGPCPPGAACAEPARLYSEGTIAVATNKDIVLDETVRYGTRNLALAVGGINVGSAGALAGAAQRGALPAGLTLNQDVMDRLLAGDTDFGTPALEGLFLTARQSVNFYESIALSTLDPATGRSRLQELVLGTPALYGYGQAGDLALIQTGALIWNGSADGAPEPLLQGPGQGAGQLRIEAERIEFGYARRAQPDTVQSQQRQVLGFAQVQMQASEQVSANHKGTLAVHQSRGEHVAGQGFQYSGADLAISTPLLTARPGADLSVTVGQDLRIDGAAGADPGAVDALGGTLSFAARGIVLDTAVALPSGRLSLAAGQNLVLGAGADIDVSGRAVDFFDQTRYSWGGEVLLHSAAGDITQDAASRIDLSARHNQGGRLSAVALGEGAGVVALAGRILGAASGLYDAGGTLVPYLGAGIEVRAQRLGQGALTDEFAALNARLNEGEVFGARSFQFKQGSLTVGDELRANAVQLSIDGGSLTVAGAIDASGAQVGSIRLAAAQGLTVAGTGVLDAHGTLLRVDGHGQIIDAPNRAVIELDAGQGALVLQAGARMDLRHGTAPQPGAASDGLARGTVQLSAPRLGADPTVAQVAVQAGGPLAIEGARSIALNATWRYGDDGPDAVIRPGSETTEGRDYRLIDQAYLDARHAESAAFMQAALAQIRAGGALAGQTAGLRAYADAFHLRPGVQIETVHDLLVQGDLDLSGHRYDSLNPNVNAFVPGSRPGEAAYGAGEPGRLAMRAQGDLYVHGSITDGFTPLQTDIDTAGWVLQPGVQPFEADVVIPRLGIALQQGTTFPAGSTLNYDLPVQSLSLPAGTVLPVAAELAAGFDVPAGTVLPGAVTVRLADGSTQLVPGGQPFAAGMRVLPGTVLPAGTRLPFDTQVRNLTWPRGVELPVAMTLRGSLSLRIGAVLPAGSNLVLNLPAGQESIALRGTPTHNWAAAPLLPAGSLSWGLRLAAGADLQAADTRAVRPDAGAGSMVLADSHYSVVMTTPPPGLQLVWKADNPYGHPENTIVHPASQAGCLRRDICHWVELPSVPSPSLLGQGFSVVRTGVGDLDLAAAGNLSLRSAFGVYTAGVEAAGQDAFSVPAFYQPRGASNDGAVLGGGFDQESLVDGGAHSVYQAWYPQGGGNVHVAAGGDLLGYARTDNFSARLQPTSAAVGNWLWRQGTGTGSGADHVPTAWWINFGTYAVEPFLPGTDETRRPHLVGFTGIGALGGGNVTMDVGGHAGVIDPSVQFPTHSQALVVAVGGTGRVLQDGSLRLTGGGDILLRAGGSLNALKPHAPIDASFSTDNRVGGALVNLRGHVQVQAGALGALQAFYLGGGQSGDAQRPIDFYRAMSAKALAGTVFVPGDAVFDVAARGNLVLGGVGDPGRVAQRSAVPFTVDGVSYPGGQSSFSLWTPHTAINLASAGGSLTPSTQMGESTGPSISTLRTGYDYSATDGRFVYPSRLAAVAFSGDIYAGDAAMQGVDAARRYGHYGLLLAPNGQGAGYLDLLAGGSLYGGGYVISRSGAAIEATSSPWRPAFVGRSAINTIVASNRSALGPYQAASESLAPLFAFGSQSAALAPELLLMPTRFYAVAGDVVALATGGQLRFSTVSPRSGATWYEGAGPLRLLAGGDIVAVGHGLGQSALIPGEMGGSRSGDADRFVSGLIVHSHDTDVSVVSAGRDILFSSFNVAGPGVLEISAGRSIRMDDRASVTSLGPVAPGDTRPGASIVMQAGFGAAGANYTGFLARYLDAANLADPDTPLAEQPGKVAKTYEEALIEWLAARYGFQPSEGGDAAAQARAYFAALPAEQQRIFARQVYFAELREGGREYNQAGGPRFGSYLRGRLAIAELFPETDAQGQAMAYQGDITMYGGAGVHTLVGGDIQMLTPGGGQTFGTEGEAPPASAGVITQGQGDIALYSLESILLGQSRIMTTFGGSILAWSAQGDINAGRGSKTTVVYTPPRRVYDSVGNVTLSSDVPSTGAGIATLAPIAEVPPGDLDLIAPLGTIDAGEAGIRSSGSVNVAALQVVNAANIQAQGETVGVPAVAAVNVGALTGASAASTAAADAAQESVARTRAAARQNLPSIISVQILGFGDEAAGGEAGAAAPAGTGSPQVRAPAYDPASPVQMVGSGQNYDARQVARLTPEERRALQQSP
ncbi:filamentous hemagglutinin family protein [Orrella sp. JC864]|uniref:filamentous haemagglutinin family protein n=1 Tax=Orrella sp. JC864 TaxID=3120298 RepID=UPI003008F4F1